jgi:hypothetical protein
MYIAVSRTADSLLLPTYSWTKKNEKKRKKNLKKGVTP